VTKDPPTQNAVCRSGLRSLSAAADRVLCGRTLRQLRVPGSLVASPFIVHSQQLLKAGASTMYKLKVSKDCSPRSLLCTACCSSASVTHDSTAECTQQGMSVSSCNYRATNSLLVRQVYMQREHFRLSSVPVILLV